MHALIGFSQLLHDSHAFFFYMHQDSRSSYRLLVEICLDTVSIDQIFAIRARAPNGLPDMARFRRDNAQVSANC